MDYLQQMDVLLKRIVAAEEAEKRRRKKKIDRIRAVLPLLEARAKDGDETAAALLVEARYVIGSEETEG